MAKIVCAMAVIHGPRATGAPETAAPEKAQQVWDGFEALRRELEETSPDWALLIANDHLTNPFFPYVAPMVVGTAPSFRSVPEESARLPEMVVPSDEAVSAQMLDAVWEAGVDLGYSYDLLLDHGSTVPLHFLTPRLDLPIVHIHQMVSRGPRPPLQRCYTLGGALRQFVEKRPASERVAVIATGGLSHWVGGPQMGQVNPAWDQWVLRQLEARADAELLSMQNADIEEQAGNGAHEIRNWITLLGTVPGAPGEVVSYVDHIPSWAQSTAHVRFRLQ